MRIAILAFATAIGLAATSASAEEITVSVSYADLDLTKPGDVTALETRLATRIRDVCAPSRGWQYRRSTAKSECVSQAMESALVKIAEAREAATSTQVAVAK
ncbi:MAG: UrcA family protein [Tsuneonella suprasediminis]|nr:UrcA family protein [Altererythrobacter sp. N1]